MERRVFMKTSRKLNKNGDIIVISGQKERKRFNKFGLFQHLEVKSAGIHVAYIHSPAVDEDPA